MLTAFKNGPNGLTSVDTITPGCWIHAVAPNPAEISRLRDEFGVPEAFITASLDLDELARTDKEDGVTFITILVPHVYGEDPTDLPYSTTPLGIILTTGQVITISKIHTNLINDFTHKHARHISTAKRNRLILQIFQAIAQNYLFLLRQIENKTDAIQRKVQVSLKNKELLELFRYQKSLIYFRTSLESNGLMMKRLQRSHLFEMYPEDQELLEDVLTEIAQATEVTKISSDILNQMMDTYASLISNNLNDVMKILAVATIILSIPMVIASLYGMNVPLPGQESGLAFGTILAISAIIAISLGLIFWKRDWL